MKRVLDAGKAAKGWQTYAWSAGNIDSRISLYQYQNNVTVASGSCDLDYAYGTDFGQWSASVSPQYTITASAGSGGTISPSGSIAKTQGDSQAFTASPTSSYVVNQWLVDGNVVQTGGTGYTLSNIQAAHSVQVTFKPNGTGSSTATRSLPSCYNTGLAGSVCITVTPTNSTSTYAVEDVPPAGWTVSNIDTSGAWDSVNHKVKWGPFFDNSPRTLCYQVTPSAGASGAQNFTGTASFDSSSVTISGNISIPDVRCGTTHPADSNADYHLTINEITSYGSAWKTGATWPVAPNPIPINYVTSAGSLWKNGEVYHYDASQAPPLCWVAGSAVAGATAFRATSARAAAFAEVTGSNSASRILPASYVPQVSARITISVSPDASAGIYAVEDAPPAGWMVSGIDNGGAWDATNHMVKWGPFFDNAPRTLTYQVTPPVGWTGVPAFFGTASFYGNSVAIGGESCIGGGCGPLITSAPAVSNALAAVQNVAVVVAGEPSVFVVGAVDPMGGSLGYQWEFGDGASSPWSPVSTASHAYTNNCGPLTARVTITNELASISSNLTVALACQLRGTKLQVKVNFATANADSCALKTSFTTEPGFNPAGKTLLLNVGDVAVSFTLDSLGRAANSAGTCRLSYNKRTGEWTLTVVLVRGSWQSAWAKHGLANANIVSSGVQVRLPVVVELGNDAFAAEPVLHYTATLNKTGTAK